MQDIDNVLKFIIIIWKLNCILNHDCCIFIKLRLIINWLQVKDCNFIQMYDLISVCLQYIYIL